MQLILSTDNERAVCTVRKWKRRSVVLCALALHSHKTHFSSNIYIYIYYFFNLNCTGGLQLSQPVLKRERMREACQQKGEWAKQEKKWRVVQSGCAWVSEREKVRVGWPCYQLGWVGQAGRRLLSTGRDRQMLTLLPGQNISPGAGSTQSGPGSCNPNDHWWRCTWPTDQLHAHWALPPFPFSPLPGPHSPLWPLTPPNSEWKWLVFTKHRRSREMSSN